MTDFPLRRIPVRTFISSFLVYMIKREIYMSRIRPFIGNELIKVLTGIRRSGNENG